MTEKDSCPHRASYGPPATHAEFHYKALAKTHTSLFCQINNNSDFTTWKSDAWPPKTPPSLLAKNESICEIRYLQPFWPSQNNEMNHSDHLKTMKWTIHPSQNNEMNHSSSKWLEHTPLVTKWKQHLGVSNPNPESPITKRLQWSLKTTMQVGWKWSSERADPWTAFTDMQIIYEEKGLRKDWSTREVVSHQGFACVDRLCLLAAWRERFERRLKQSHCLSAAWRSVCP